MTLSSKVAALTGPDRAVDAEVMFDLYAKPVGVSKIDGGPSGYLWPEDNPSWSFGMRFPGKNREWFGGQRQEGDGERLLIERDGALVLMNDLRVPPLTASLDAAMSVVDLQRFTLSLTIGAVNLVFLTEMHDDPLVEPPCFEATAPTPALALLSAALAARGL